jgi:ADP-heptose:LPS heptosyltransferase
MSDKKKSYQNNLLETEIMGRNNILVLNNHGLGDVVMSFPFFEKLLEYHNNSKILVVLKSNLELELFSLTKLYVMNPNKFKLYLREDIKRIFRYFFRIKAAYALGVNERKSKIIFRSLGVNNFYIASPYKYMQSLSGNILYNKGISHKSTLYLNLLDISNHSEFEAIYKDYFVDSNNHSVVVENYMILAGGSGDLEKHKRWPIYRYKELVDKVLNKTDLNIVFVGSKEEKKIVDDILIGISSKFSNRIIQLNGKTSLLELIEIIRDSKIVVGNDNGVLHIASACNAKILGLFGSTDYNITGPNGNHVTIIDNRIKCAPCYAKNGSIFGCEDNLCMKGIESDKVFKKIIEIIK